MEQAVHEWGARRIWEIAFYTSFHFDMNLKLLQKNSLDFKKGLLGM